MTIIKRSLVLIFLLAYGVLTFGQTPTVVPLDYNPALLNREPAMLKSAVQADTVSLPFFDDFSGYWQSSHPDRKWWMDDYVYINNNYPILPRSNGVATFDALDADGCVYKKTTATFPADTLTSCPIDLGGSGLNNVYLSFFYQPKGHGDNPDPGDSLILQYKQPVTGIWHTVWRVRLDTKARIIEERTENRRKVLNIPEDTGNTGDTVQFIPVLLPVEDEYLYRGFQFRFVNYVSLEQNTSNPGKVGGDVDHWHIDYVYLDRNRSQTDVSMYDAALIAPMKSLIKGYRSIPWNQMPVAIISGLEPMIEMTYRNNYNFEIPVQRYFTITDVYNETTPVRLPGGREDVKADGIVTFYQDIFNPYESASVDSAMFELKGFLATIPEDRVRENDTVRCYQFFKDYFARDDGTPENGYGFSGYNAHGCAVACRYETFREDTLRAVMLYFNPTVDNVTAQYRFRIAVWRDDRGRPGERVYLSPTEYSPKTVGQFTRYDLGIPLKVTDYYWIGWVQVTSGFLNAGFDGSFNDKGNLWYNAGKDWEQDMNDGTLMIRPVMGKKKDLPTSSEQPATITDTGMKLYPNPAAQFVRIGLETGEPGVFTNRDVEIYDMTGRLRYRAPFTGEYIDLNGFEQGMYLVRLINKKLLHIQTEKLMIIR